MIDTARALGVGQRTGIDLPAEVRRLPRHARLRPGEAAARGTAGRRSSSASARGTCRSRRCRTRGGPPPSPPGTLVTPRLGLAVGTGEGTYTAPPVAGRDAAAVRRRAGTDPRGDAGGRRPAAPRSGSPTSPRRSARKTGTAQDGGLPDGSYDNWMTAAAPMDDPEIVMTALVQGPGPGWQQREGRGGRRGCATTSTTGRRSSPPDRCRPPDVSSGRRRRAGDGCAGLGPPPRRRRSAAPRPASPAGRGVARGRRRSQGPASLRRTPAHPRPARPQRPAGEGRPGTWRACG